jgi:hypothetical protein
LTPSRGRPDRLGELAEAIHETAEAPVDLWVGLDADDEHQYPRRDGVHYLVRERMRLGPWVNHLARLCWDDYDVLGFLGDDHRPRTPGWDRIAGERLARMGSGFAYGNDLIHGKNLPTAVFVTADIVRKLGYLCFPGAQHLYFDNCWKVWGEGIGRLAYLPDVVIEHMHPLANKAEMDRGYEEVNALYGPDGAAWDAYQADGLQADLAKLRSLL